MIFIGLVVATWLAARLTAVDDERGPARAWLVVLAVSLAQGLIGYVQYFTDLPEALVVAHMLGASLLVVALTHGILALRTRTAAAEPVPGSVSDRLSVGSVVEQARGAGQRHGLAARCRAELGQDVGHVHARRLGADEQGTPDLAVGAPLGEQPEHLGLAGGEVASWRGAARGEPVEGRERGALRRARCAVSRAAARTSSAPGSPAASSTSASLRRERAATS